MRQDVQQFATPLEIGRDAYARHAWHDAFDAFSAADAAEPLGPQDLSQLAEAAWFDGHPGIALEARKRAHAGYLSDGDECAAALMAVLVADSYFDRLNMPVGGGWLARAGRLLDGVDGWCPAHVWHALVSAGVAAHGTGDLQEAVRQATRAREISAELGNGDLQALALGIQGATLAALGRTDEGVALLDEATVAAVSGEVDPYVTGVIYCATIDVCSTLTDWGRASQWTEEAEQWCKQQGITGFPGVCRIHKAEILQLRGSWVEAESEARRANEELTGYALSFRAKGLYTIGELRLRVGDLSGAREAFTEARELNLDAEPGMSLVQLLEGDAAGALGGIQRALDITTVPFERIRLLPAAVQIAISAGDVDTARRCVEELTDSAATFKTTALQAAAAASRGLLLLAQDDPRAAAAELRRAIEGWNEVGAPYDAARARTALGEAYRAAGDDSGATVELTGAKAAFERLGAIPDARRVDQLLGGSGGVATRSGGQVVRTFMFTDIVGSTPLAEALGDAAWQDAMRWHDLTLRSHIDRHGGSEVRHTGDGFFVAFPQASAAVEAAVGIQRALEAHRREHGFAPQVRIGLHEGTATARGQDFAGVSVHEAARIGALADAGEIVASGGTVEDTAVRYPLSSPRTVTLKGVSGPVEVVSVQWR